MAKIEIHNQTLAFEIIRRKRKTLEIQIDTQNGFRVIAPNRLSEKAILKILEPRKEWILEKWTEVKNAQALKPQKSYTDGESFALLGVMVKLHLIENKQLKKATARYESGQLIVSSPELTREMIRPAVVAFYKAYTKAEAEKRIIKYTSSLGVQYNRLLIKEQKRRWGSCSHLGNLNFNWRCGMMPEQVFEYILAHEVCHLVHLNHSKAYWDLVASVSPQYAEARLWLKKQGATLDI